MCVGTDNENSDNKLTIFSGARDCKERRLPANYPCLITFERIKSIRHSRTD